VTLRENNDPLDLPRVTATAEAGDKAAADPGVRATGEDLIADAQRLTEVEEQKRDLPADDPRLPELAVESEGLTASMAVKARTERQRVNDRQRDRGSGSA
jgi:hypothetical protein